MMSVWTPERITTLRQLGAALRAVTFHADLTYLVSEVDVQARRAADIAAEWELAEAYAAGLYQGQQLHYDHEAGSHGDIPADPDL